MNFYKGVDMTQNKQMNLAVHPIVETNQGYQGQTGPKSTLGKQHSAQNARKSAIFVKGSLEWENIEQKQQQHEALCAQWEAGNDPTRQMLIRTIEQGQLEQERIMYAQKQKIEGAMQSLSIAQAFAKHANLDPIYALSMPAWFFSQQDQGQKERALFLDKVWVQAALFKQQYRDSLVSQVASTYPDLFEYVMQNQVPQASFLTVLGQRYKQSTPQMNLVQLANEIVEKYPDHLKWARAPERHQIIIDGLRAQLMFEAMELDKTSRYMTSIQNRLLKSIQALMILKQSDERAQAQQNIVPAVMTMTQAVPMPEEVSTRGKQKQCQGDENAQNRKDGKSKAA